MNIVRGQRIKLSDLGLANKSFSICIKPSAHSFTLDSACFGLDSNRKLSDDRYMTFFNQTLSPCGAVRLINANQFDFDLAKLPASIHYLTLTLAIEGNGVMRELGQSLASFSVANTEVARYQFDGQSFSNERAIMLIELYRKDSEWRVNIVGQGFDGGLDALVRHFGGEVAEDKSNAHSASPSVASPPIIPAPIIPTPVAPASAKVSLEKITLQKSGDKVSLKKQGAHQGFGKIRVNLKWNQSTGEKTFFGQPKRIDLDVGCMFELKNGQTGVVQALGNDWGNFNHPPFINLDSDDRSGNSREGETLWINGNQFSEIKRILIYTFIYEGAANWTKTNGIVLVEVPDQPPVEVKLDGADDRRMCAIALLENINETVSITKLVQYFEGHRQVNERYNFKLNFRSGRK